MTDSVIISKISIFGSNGASIIINNPIASTDSGALGSFNTTSEISILLGVAATHPAFRFQVLANDSVTTCSNIAANAKVPVIKYTHGLKCDGRYSIKVEQDSTCH